VKNTNRNISPSEAPIPLEEPAEIIPPGEPRPVVTITWKVVFEPVEGEQGTSLALLNDFIARGQQAAREAGKAKGFVPVDGHGQMNCRWPKPKRAKGAK
jgi:hypothetical protein